MKYFKNFLILLGLVGLLGCSSLQKNINNVPEQNTISQQSVSPDDLQKLTEQGETTKARAYTSYEGVSSGALGKTPCTSLVTGDQAWVGSSSSSAFYTFDSTDTTAEDTTDKKYIHCYDASWSAGNWILLPLKTTIVNPSNTPTITGYDEGDSEDAWEITGSSNGTDGTMDFKAQTAASTLTKFMGLDGTNEEIDVVKPINSTSTISATGIDAGIKIKINSGNIDIDTSYPGICRMMFTVGNASTTYQLPNDVMCTANYGKELCFTTRGAVYIKLTPDSSDIMSVGSGGSGTAGQSLLSATAAGEAICIVGRDSGVIQYWTNKGAIDGTWSIVP